MNALEAKKIEVAAKQLEFARAQFLLRHIELMAAQEELRQLQQLNTPERTSDPS